MRCFLNVLLAAGIFIAAAPVMAQRPVPKLTGKEPMQADLFMALTTGTLADVKVALDEGADPNGPDFIGLTPLCYTRDIATVKLLVSKGARVNEDTIKGSALTNTLLAGNDKLGVYFLSIGAKPEPSRDDATSPLMDAAYTGCINSLRLLLKEHAIVNERNIDGATALTFAVRGNQPAAAKLLLTAGARINEADDLKRTPLHYAALYDFPGMTSLLLAHGASVNAVDSQGATPLHLAARYTGDPVTIHALLAAGASKTAQDKRGKTPVELASRRGYDAAARLLLPPSSGRPTTAPANRSVGAAITPALGLIQTSMQAFQGKAPCVSCHHQGLGVIALAHASQRQLPINNALFASYLKQLADDADYGAPAVHGAIVDPKQAKMIPVLHLGDYSYTTGYVLAAERAAGVPVRASLAENAVITSRLQEPSGCWAMNPRGVMQHSYVTNTAMVLEAMNAYWPTDQKSDLEARKAKAKAWALSMKSGCAEDLAGRILLLKQAGADDRQIAVAATALFHAQRPDGGWGVIGSPRSDAYTTGLSLYALRSAANIPASTPRLHRAVDFLLRTQDEDGSWYEAKTTPAFNNHFDASFPHGYDQFASFAGTCWATIGLMEVLDPQTPGQTAMRHRALNVVAK